MERPIVDPSDPALEPYRDLRAEHRRRADAGFVCEGALCARRALESRLVMRSVLTSAAQLGALRPLLSPEIEVLVAAPALIREVAGFKFHRGCLAYVLRPPLAPADFEALTARGRSNVVFAEAVSDPANVGALVRNARSLGADLVVLDQSSGDPWSRKAVRSAMGNVFTLPLAVVPDLGEALEAYRRVVRGEVWAATLSPRACPVSELTRPAHVALLVGSEGKGVSEMLVRRCHREVTIPMAPGADSLNVAAASAVLLYALMSAPHRP